MGGVFRAPKDNGIDPQIAIKAAEEKAQKEALERQRRGLEGTIKTSNTGILKTDNEQDFKRKKLLGE